MKYNEFKVQTRVWLYPGKAGWYFVTIPKDISDDVDSQFGDLKRGWGSLRVTATIGETSWDTSIFPDKKTGEYLLPVKAAVRKKENIGMDDKVTLFIEIKR